MIMVPRRENAGEMSGKETKIFRGRRYQGATRPRKHCIPSCILLENQNNGLFKKMYLLIQLH